MRGDLTDKGFTEKVEQIYKNFNNGDDDATRSIYVTERNTGARGSAILKHVYDMVELDNLQKADVKAILNALVDEHIEEVDLLDQEKRDD
jgi:DNA-binding ferritin-like protein (Dps family)